jgi:hypothetical protein
MKRLPLGIILITSLGAVSHFSGGHVGTSVECVNGSCVVRASSSLMSVVLGAGFLALMMFLPRRPIAAGTASAGFARMVGAVFIDMARVITGLGAVLALPMLLAEQSYTGAFHWAFTRNSVRSMDWILAGGAAFASFAVILAMRIRAMTAGTPSLGQYLMGYVVLSDAGSLDLKTALKRCGWGALYLSLWPIYLIYKVLARPEKDKWDCLCGTRSAKFTYVS